MKRCIRIILTATLIVAASSLAAADVKLSGELKQWHKVTLTLSGLECAETNNSPNPFTDFLFSVVFTHESGSPRYVVPGYFAADGNSANTGASAGDQWRAHLSPDKAGVWNYTINFGAGKNAAVGDKAVRLQPFDGISGSFKIDPTDKKGRDFRAKGRLEYVGKHYLQFAGTKEYFLKVGSDAPETFLGYAEFDNTVAGRKTVPLKTWGPHVKDWAPGDPVWGQGRGKGMIGALNYLASRGVCSFSFLTYNAGGDGDNVWPFVQRDDKLHYDCSKLDQWQIVFDHAQKLGLYLHFKTQETENDDLNGPGAGQSLDGGELGIERKLYYRELIARFGYELALNWNLGEENSQSPEQQRAMAQYFHDTDPYHHNIVIHTFPNEQDKVYTQLLGTKAQLTGASLQNEWDEAHERTLKWVKASEQAGKPWVVANDEQGSAAMGVPPDPGYENFNGLAKENEKSKAYTLDDVRKLTLWGNLMAGGAGVEYYFGYKLPQNDLICEDYRSRDKSWDYGRIALGFFYDNKIPFCEMTNADELVGNPTHSNSRFCFAKSGQIYLVYLPKAESVQLDLSGASGSFGIQWFNPRKGGKLLEGTVKKTSSGSSADLGQPPTDANEDWLAVVTKL